MSEDKALYLRVVNIEQRREMLFDKDVGMTLGEARSYLTIACGGEKLALEVPNDFFKKVAKDVIEREGPELDKIRQERDELRDVVTTLQNMILIPSDVPANAVRDSFSRSEIRFALGRYDPIEEVVDERREDAEVGTTRVDKEHTS